MHTEESLRGLKLGELKALCKELRIAKHSKLSQALLIQKITESQEAHGDLLTVTDKTTQEGAVQNDNGSSQKKSKAKRKSSSLTESSSSPSKKIRNMRSSKNKDPRASQHLGSDPVIQNGALQIPSKEASSVTKGALTDPTMAFQTNSPPPAPSDPHVLPVAGKVSTPNAADGPPSTPDIARASVKQKPMTKTTLNPEGCIKSTPKRVATPFKPLQIVKRPVVPPTSAITPPLPVHRAILEDLQTSSLRIAYIRDSWINEVFLHLNATRNIPIKKAPSPSVIPLPQASCTRDLAFQGVHPDLYEKADPKSFKVAVRFCIARLYTLMYLGNGEAWSVLGGGRGILGPDLAKWDMITTSKQVSSDIWLIVTQGAHQQEERTDNSHGFLSRTRYLVLEGNGEVIASDRSQAATQNQDFQDGGYPTVHGCPVRADWHTMLRPFSEDQGSSPFDLLDHVKTKNDIEYPQGISKTWLQRMQNEDSPTASEMLQTAQRAVLSSCAANSFSGSKLSATAMDAEHLGHVIPTGTKASSRLELYLPESSQVVTVHLSTNGRPLHPALALVHRQSGFSDFVLKETGQIVGEEDAGVSELWQGLLGCDERGREDEDRSKDFWQGWEERLLQ
ncbi:hypothetical protein I316_04617 [Kwoniella heveanensis BCC8398]|uniref:Rho termination factor N-terminal domain-containing protein n=1 Tax=Kwoniella heveanensis BCC8398 TaxID=1296120 RepID=A0A1B9GRS1_9TREE|nr:hypothetical protein I316_04617 [Kwoniella heveanensis BCC8398]